MVSVNLIIGSSFDVDFLSPFETEVPLSFFVFFGSSIFFGLVALSPSFLLDDPETSPLPFGLVALSPSFLLDDPETSPLPFGLEALSPSFLLDDP